MAPSPTEARVHLGIQYSAFFGVRNRGADAFLFKWLLLIVAYDAIVQNRNPPPPPRHPITRHKGNSNWSGYPQDLKHLVSLPSAGIADVCMRSKPASICHNQALIAGIPLLLSTLPQGSKGQEGELFGIQNLLKFSDDSLLKALRMKHDASTTGSRAGGGGNNADNKGAKNTDKLGGVDATDEKELVLAMQEAVGRAQEERDTSKPQQLGFFLFFVFFL